MLPKSPPPYTDVTQELTALGRGRGAPAAAAAGVGVGCAEDPTRVGPLEHSRSGLEGRKGGAAGVAIGVAIGVVIGVAIGVGPLEHSRSGRRQVSTRSYVFLSGAPLLHGEV